MQTETHLPVARSEGRMISTSNLSLLPAVDDLERLLQSLAMLDAILSPEWEYRYYSFNANWGQNERMGSMRNGHGDHFFAVFNAAGCWLKGFWHESPLLGEEGWPQKILKAVPLDFTECLQEPAFDINDTTFCLWRTYSESSWNCSTELPAIHKSNGSSVLLAVLDGKPQTYQKWASRYYGRAISLGAIQHVYAHRNISGDLVSELNPNCGFEGLSADIQEIGYPQGETS